MQPTNNVERTLPSVNDNKSKSGKKKALWTFLIVVLLLGGCALYFTVRYIRHRAADATKQAPKTEQQTTKKRSFNDSFVRVAGAGPATASDSPNPGNGPATSATEAAQKLLEQYNKGKKNDFAAPDAGGAPGAQPPGQRPGQAGQANGSGQQTGAKVVKNSSLDSDLVTNDGGSPGKAKGGGGPGSAVAKALTGAAEVTDEANALTGRNTDGGAMKGMLTSTYTPKVRAGILSNPSLTAKKGTTALCVLRTKIVAMIPGLIICDTSEPIWSADGKVVLAEAGTEVTGEQSGQMKQGQVRLYVLWGMLYTPNNVTMQIDSPGADALGGAGVDGYVDKHWSERIGAALVLSTIQDVFAYEIAKSSSGGGQNYAQNTSQSGQKMAEKVLDSTINIPPTLYKNQGETVTIMINRDLDFSSVYQLEAK